LILFSKWPPQAIKKILQDRKSQRHQIKIKGGVLTSFKFGLVQKVVTIFKKAATGFFSSQKSHIWPYLRNRNAAQSGHVDEQSSAEQMQRVPIMQMELQILAIKFRGYIQGYIRGYIPSNRPPSATRAV
jgi:hypothetical protein